MRGPGQSVGFASGTALPCGDCTAEEPPPVSTPLSAWPPITATDCAADSGSSASWVRSNAARSLVALSVLAKLDPSSDVRISATWFIEMLNSLSWSDRNRALWALQTLTDSRDPLVLDQLRTRALDALVDMARWKTLSHALPAFILLGRTAGMPEPDIQAAWTRGDRDSVISAAKKKAK